MKLILTSREQFDVIWNQSAPLNRHIGDLGCPSVFFATLNAYVINSEHIEIGSISELEMNPITLAAVSNIIAAETYTEVK